MLAPYFEKQLFGFRLDSGRTTNNYIKLEDTPE